MCDNIKSLYLSEYEELSESSKSSISSESSESDISSISSESSESDISSESEQVCEYLDQISFCTKKLKKEKQKKIILSGGIEYDYSIEYLINYIKL